MNVHALRYDMLFIKAEEMAAYDLISRSKCLRCLVKCKTPHKNPVLLIKLSENPGYRKDHQRTSRRVPGGVIPEVTLPIVKVFTLRQLTKIYKM